MKVHRVGHHRVAVAHDKFHPLSFVDRRRQPALVVDRTGPKAPPFADGEDRHCRAIGGHPEHNIRPLRYRERLPPHGQRHNRIAVDAHQASLAAAEIDGEVGGRGGVDDPQAYLAIPLYVDDLGIIERERVVRRLPVRSASPIPRICQRDPRSDAPMRSGSRYLPHSGSLNRKSILSLTSTGALLQPVGEIGDGRIVGVGAPMIRRGDDVGTQFQDLVEGEIFEERQEEGSRGAFRFACV
jgi:hypothetical protein